MTSMSTLPVVIGVDIGGTNTDAVLLHNGDDVPRVLSEVKEQTTHDVIDGVRRAILRCLLQAKDKGFRVAPIQVNIGTTRFINAVVQHKDLARVAVIRICGPASHELPPFCDFPTKLADMIRGPIHLVHGGFNIEGKEMEPLDEEEIRKVITGIKDQCISNICIVGIFSSISPSQELRARDIAMELYPEATVSLSHEIGDIGLLERENATILNECLKPLCKRTLVKFEEAFDDMGIDCPYYFTQNDGTIISSTDVLRFPVLTFASGPTNSMRGAAFLTAKTEAVVVDIGGTTSDVGILKMGFPRESATHVHVAGVKTNFRMPDVISIGLGGGSYVVEKRGEDGGLLGMQVGPLSAGFNLHREALVYNEEDSTEGRALTATDIAVCSGLCTLGSKERVGHLAPNVVSESVDEIHKMLENLVDRIKLSKDKVPIIIVGGGSVLVDTKRPFRGASELIIPKHFGVANAIGAALSKVSASCNSIVNLLGLVDIEAMDSAVSDAKMNVDSGSDREMDIAVENAKTPFLKNAREDAIARCCDQAKSQVIKLGARKDSIKILDKSDSLIPYIAGRVLNIKVKVVGNMNQLDMTGEGVTHWTEPKGLLGMLEKKDQSDTKQNMTSTGVILSTCSTDDNEDDNDSVLSPKEPFIDTNTGEWILSDWDIECIAIGSGIYGCGGGGSHYMGKLRALRALREGKELRVVRAERLLENADPKKDLIFTNAIMGSPTPVCEQGVSTVESKEAFRCLKDMYEIGRFKEGHLQNTDGVTVEEDETGSRYISNYRPVPEDKNEDYNIIGIMAMEFAGMNALEPLLLASNLNIPLIDADGTSRAFPKIEQYIPFIYGKTPYPGSAVGIGNTSERAVLLYAPQSKQSEDHFRDIAIKNGCYAHLMMSLTKSEVLTKTVPHVVSSAWRLGDAVLRARLQKQPVIDAIAKQENGEHVISGKVVDVRQETSGGFNKGHVTVEGTDEWAGQAVEIEFQNEFLVIFSLEDGKRGTNKACVPDLIAVVDSDTGEPIHGEEIRYGMRIAVIIIPSCDLLRHPEALKWVGPTAFNYPQDVSFVPFRERKPVQPIPPP